MLGESRYFLLTHIHTSLTLAISICTQILNDDEWMKNQKTHIQLLKEEWCLRKVVGVLLEGALLASLQRRNSA